MVIEQLNEHFLFILRAFPVYPPSISCLSELLLLIPLQRAKIQSVRHLFIEPRFYLFNQDKQRASELSTFHFVMFSYFASTIQEKVEKFLRNEN